MFVVNGHTALVAGASGLVAACATSLEIFAGMPDTVFFLDPNRLGRGRRPGLEHVVRHIAGALGVRSFVTTTTLEKINESCRGRDVVVDLDIFKDRSVGLPSALANEANVAYSATGVGYLQSFLPKIPLEPNTFSLRIAQMRWIAARRLQSNGIRNYFVAAPIEKLQTVLGAAVEAKGIDRGLLHAIYRQAGMQIAFEKGLLGKSPEVILLLPFAPGKDGHDITKGAIKFASAQVGPGQQIWVKSHPRAEYDWSHYDIGGSLLNLNEAMGQAWPIEALLVHHPLTRLVTEASSAVLVHKPDRTTLLNTESSRCSLDSRLSTAILKNLGYGREVRL